MVSIKVVVSQFPLVGCCLPGTFERRRLGRLEASLCCSACCAPQEWGEEDLVRMLGLHRMCNCLADWLVMTFLRVEIPIERSAPPGHSRGIPIDLTLKNLLGFGSGIESSDGTISDGLSPVNYSSGRLVLEIESGCRMMVSADYLEM